MAEKKNVMTTAGARKLEEELQMLRVERREEIKKKLQEARMQGDLSENAEYDAAKQEQAEVEARIEEIQLILQNAEIVAETTDTSRVFVGAVVKVLDVEEDDEFEVTIVGTNEADSLKNLISNESPMGSALINAAVGDTVMVSAPAGDFPLKVLEIRRQ